MNIYEQLAKSQGEFPTIQKTKTGQVGLRKYQYADLSDVLKAVLPVLSRNGLSLTQTGSFQGEIQMLVTTLSNKEGANISSSFALPPSPDAQRFGANLTYYRRYAICSLLGVVGDDDTDGDVTSDKGNPQEGPQKPNGGQTAAPNAKPEVKSHSPNPVNSVPGKSVSSVKKEQSWEIPFGKFKGMDLYTMHLDDMRKYANQLITMADEQNKQLNGAALEFVNRVREMAGFEAFKH